MIDKLYDQYEMICDICDDTGIPCDTFNECRHVMRDQGWRTKKVDGEWMDMCPSCYAQYQVEGKSTN